MSRFERFSFFSYGWGFVDEDTAQGKQVIIRIYGWNEKLEPTYIRVEDFMLPVIVELDENIDWTDTNINALCNRLQSFNKNPDMRPRTILYEEKQRSYYAYVNKLDKPNPKTGHKYEHKKFPYLMALFSSMEAADRFTGDIRRGIDVPQLGKLHLKTHASERSITPVLKFMGIRQLPSSGWMKGSGTRLTKEEQESTRRCEYCISYQNLEAMSEEESMKMPIPIPKVMAFDNEANSTYMNSMPKAKRPGDKTFQISYTILDPPKAGRPKQYRKYLISMGNPDPIEGVVIFKVKTEADLYVKFSEEMRKEDPEIVLGFNILGWDMNYMIQRCENMCRCMGEFDLMGCIQGLHAPKATINWGSKGSGKNTFEYLEVEGRVFIDLLPYIKRNYKLHNYRLATCCEEFLKTATKDDVKPKEIFKTWRKHLASVDDPDNKVLSKEAGEQLARVGKYCCQDSTLCIMLYEKLQVWADLSESSTVCQVPMFDMFTKGQQIRMYSQVYRYGFHNGITVESNGYTAKDNEHYQGAYVSDPIKGLYDMIVPFDFNSLYPTIMMSHNIDYSKLVINDSIPDEDCHILKWSDHQYCGCPKDEYPDKKAPKLKDGTTKKVCAEYKYRWLKHEVSGKGIIPTLLENLITARKKTRKIIEVYENEIKLLKKIINKESFTEDNIETWNKRFAVYDEKKEQVHILNLLRAMIKNSKDLIEPFDLTDEYRKLINERVEILESLILVLDRRQNAYKVNANSMYGAMGVKKGYLPFLPGAMCVTYVGRSSIHKVNDYITDKHGGIPIYNDTDSAYCHFPQFRGRPVKELWAHAKMIVNDVKSMFPPPMSLDFENKIYKKFLILTKKRYVAVAVNEEGKIDSKLLKRGIVLQRRDNSTCLREVYQSLVLKIFDNHESLVDLKTESQRLRNEDIELEKQWREECESRIREYTEINHCPDIIRDALLENINKTLGIKPIRKPKSAVKSDSKTKKKAIPKNLPSIELPPKPQNRAQNLINSHSVVRELLQLITDAINSLFQWKYSYKHFVITKQIARDFKEYKNPQRLPGHVQLGLRMQKRGIPVGGGTRVEYVIMKTEPYSKDATQASKIEDVGYFSEFREILRLSYLDYLCQFINPIDEVCDVAMGIKNFVKTQFDIRLKHSRVVDRISELKNPKLVFDKESKNNSLQFAD